MLRRKRKEDKEQEEEKLVAAVCDGRLRDNNLSNASIGDEEIIEMMIQFPKLIQRPILDNGKRAIIGRPPEKILELL